MPMYNIKHIKLKDIKGFKELDLPVVDANDHARKRTVVLGKNGTGKSTLLRCIVIGLCDPADGNALLAEELVGRLVAEDASTAEIEITLIPHDGKGKPHTIKTRIENKDDKDSVVEQSGTLQKVEEIFVCGYGVGRHSTGGESGRTYRIIDSTYTLFVYEQTLMDTELVLRRLEDFLETNRYKNTKAGILKALGLTQEDDFYLPKGGGVEFSGPSLGNHIRFKGLADGYRLTFSWIIDLYGWAMRAKTINPSGSINGVLLVDELEQHIHPSMQAYILTRLGELLPDIQIFSTTHSPLVALGASHEELVVLKKKQKYVDAVKNIPDFSGYSAEDMLIDSRLFDSTVYSPETSKNLEEYRKIAKIPKKERTEAQEEKLRSLAHILGNQEIPDVAEISIAKELRKFREKFDL